MRGFWLLAMVAVAAAVQFQPTHRLSPSVLRPQREALGLAQIGEDPKPVEPTPPSAEAGTDDADKPVTAVATDVDTKPADKPADSTANTGDKPADAKAGETKPTDSTAAPDAGKAEPEKQEAKPETAEKTDAETKKDPPLVDLTKEEDDTKDQDTTDKDKESTDGEAEAGSDNPMFAPDPEDKGGDDTAEDATKDATTEDTPHAEDEDTGIGPETEEPDAEPAEPQAEEEGEGEPTDDANLKSVDKPNHEAEEQEEQQKEAADEAAESEESTGEEEAPAEPTASEDDKPFVPPEKLSLEPAPDATTKKKVPDEFEKRLDVLQDLVDRLEDKFLAQYGKNIRPRPRNTKLDAVYASKIDQLEQRILDLGNRLRPNSQRVSPRPLGTGNTPDDKRLDTLTRRVAEIDQALANSPSIAPVSVEPGTPNLDANGDGQTRTLFGNNNFPRRFNHLPKYPQAPAAPPESTEPETVDSLRMNDPNAPENMPRDVPDWVSKRNWREPIMKFKQRAGRKAGRR